MSSRACEAKGARFVEELDEVPHGAVTIFSAHGVSRAVEDEAETRGLPVLDATCPLVSKVHNQGQRYVAQGRTVILIGHAGHPEVEGTMGQVTGRSTWSSAPRTSSCSPFPTTRPVAYITQTTLSVDDTRAIIAALKAPLHRIVGPETRDICYATQNRQTAVRELAQRRRRDPGGRREQQLQLQPAARNRRGGGHAELSDRRRQRGRSASGSRAQTVGYHRRRLGAGGAGRTT